MSKHTPGPWAQVHVDRVMSNDGRHIANVDGADCIANARLIAAAPDLYQHVSEYLELCEKMKDAKDSEERADYLSIMVGLKGEMKRTIDKVNGNG